MFETRLTPIAAIAASASEWAGRAILLRELRDLGCPAACFFWCDQTAGALVQRLRPVWVDIRHNRQVPHPAFDPMEYARQKTRNVPTAVLKWMIQREKPVRLSQIGRYFPRFARSVLRGGDPYGLEPLEEVVGIPYWHDEQYQLLLVTLLRMPSQAEVSRIMGLSLTYLSAWQDHLADLAAQPISPQGGRMQGSRPTLTEQEIACLRWAVAGKTLQDIAEITGYRYRTVRHVLDRVRDRYGYATFQQTLAQVAIDYGFDPWGQTPVIGTRPDGRGDQAP